MPWVDRTKRVTIYYRAVSRRDLCTLQVPHRAFDLRASAEAPHAYIAHDGVSCDTLTLPQNLLIVCTSARSPPPPRTLKPHCCTIWLLLPKKSKFSLKGNGQIHGAVLLVSQPPPPVRPPRVPKSKRPPHDYNASTSPPHDYNTSTSMNNSEKPERGVSLVALRRPLQVKTLDGLVRTLALYGVLERNSIDSSK